MTAPPTVIGISPARREDVGLAASVCQAGALSVLDLGPDNALGKELEVIAQEIAAPFGVLVSTEKPLDPATLPSQIDSIILTSPADLSRWRHRRTWVQVTNVAEAREAHRAGAQGLIAKGCESGGRVGEESSFILLQRLVREFHIPIWVQGGIGLHTAAAAVAGGATGVVLDTQLALVSESRLPEAVKSAIAHMDSSDTAVFSGWRALRRLELAQNRAGNELPRDSLLVGQDAAWARPFAERFQTARGVIQAIQQSVVEHLRQAQTANPLGPGAPLALSHGILRPIVQGPMTRVSDRPAFAQAVSLAGGLPFIALSLIRGEQLRNLLSETATLLRGRAWGVGILGFVPPEIREEQLAAILEVSPPVALIAGGRPSQARLLETAGIATYLHVPAVGLLDMFLKDGARRFVFEGSECGGHVGPLTSFVLWETQIQRLLEFEHPEQLSVLFAGGVHDARSAAMVAAMAAPLAARGARIGVLAGSAYLFTHEAVECGAIGRAYQLAALESAGTALLEMGPGHAIRCAQTDYVRAFAQEKCRLEQQGMDPRRTWEALEQLNLGRLRIAAKGLSRDQDQLVTVDEEAQLQDGMFMMGQVAALRSETCTIADLHRDMSEGATAHLASVRVSETRESERAPTDVAIVGMACMFPGAPDLDTYWSNIVRGVNSITEVPRDRWDPDLYYDPSGPPGEKTPSKWGGFLTEVEFHPTSYGIPPRSVPAIEPVQLLSLQVARQALADAGYAGKDFPHERTSVIFGAEAGTDLANAYSFRALFPRYVGPMPAALRQNLPSLTEDSFPGVLANVIAGRISNRLDLGGANYTVDAACASSLAAVDLACKELMAGTSDMVLCGGADLHNGVGDYLLFSSAHALSPTGQCKTFDAHADGIVLGEGVGVIVLKRDSDARRDGDRIYAVIKGVGASSDGRSLGLTAPRREGQVRALDRAYQCARLSPADVGLVEAHGTGTVVGDATEIATLHEVFGRAGTKRGSCVLGSVKSQIGHTKCAAGLAGLIKAALALHHRVLPPTLNVRQPNPSYRPGESPFLLLDTAQPWISEQRNAGVSAFGFGGTNFHVVLTSARDGDTNCSGVREWTEELFLLRGSDRAVALQAADLMAAHMGADSTARLRDLAYTAAASGEGPVQIAIVASKEDLKAKVASAGRAMAPTNGNSAKKGAKGLVAFLFPGQGSQRPGMLAELFVAFPRLHRLLAPESRWRRCMFPPAAFGQEEKAAQHAAITDTRAAQSALGIAGLAMAEVLSWCGVRPDMLGGHSYGELVALCVAGSLPPGDLVRLSEARGECMMQVAGDEPGSMAAVHGAAAEVHDAVGRMPGVVIANFNAPDQFVISGAAGAIQTAGQQLARLGLPVHPIAVGCAFHSPLVARASGIFFEKLQATDFVAPKLPVWCNSTASPYPAEPELIRRQLAEHLALPVRFVEEIEAMYAAGARVFVEVGPGRVLTGLVKRILGDRPHTAVACDDGGPRSLHPFLLALAELAANGVPVDPSPLFIDRGTKRVVLNGLAQNSGPADAWLVNGQRAWPVQGELPEFAGKPNLQPIGMQGAGNGDQAVVEYLRNMRELAEQQREVMIRCLGGAPSPALAPVRMEPQPIQPAPVQEPVKPSAPAPAPRRNVTEELRAIISDRTGYPAEMLDLDLDMEADLSIDSIKRVEILALLSDRLGLRERPNVDQDKVIEELAQKRTLRGIIEWLERIPGIGLKGGAEKPAPTPVPPAPEPPAKIAMPLARLAVALERIPAPYVNGHGVRGRSFLVVPEAGTGVAGQLTASLQREGASIRLLQPGKAVERTDGVIYLASLGASPADDVVHELFRVAKDALSAGTGQLLVATGFEPAVKESNGHVGPLGGVAGFVKSLAREWPELRVRVVGLELSDGADRLTEILHRELLSEDGPVEVNYRNGVRHAVRTFRRPLGSKPAAAGLKLGAESVVLLTGGARGITAQISVELARRYHCRLELVGRTPLQVDEDDEQVAGARDPTAIRSLLVSRHPNWKPAEIEATCRRIVATQEIRRTLTAIREAQGSAIYHPFDVSDPQAFGSFIDDLYSRHGRLDGVVHGAGIVEDKRLIQKSAESFRRVFDTKVSAALTLAEKVHDDLGFAVFFSSISGLLGNPGQADYAAASEVLDKIALRLSKRLQARVVSINWGPWDEVGMVTPELRREFLRRGFGLISPEEGREAFFSELAWGHPADVQVVWIKGGIEALW